MFNNVQRMSQCEIYTLLRRIILQTQLQGLQTREKRATKYVLSERSDHGITKCPPLPPSDKWKRSKCPQSKHKGNNYSNMNKRKNEILKGLLKEGNTDTKKRGKDIGRQKAKGNIIHVSERSTLADR